MITALITISTRASLKRYHDYTLTLGLGDDASRYEFLRIGTKSEKESVAQELKELREQLSRADELKQRRDEIVEELNKVWTAKEGESVEEASIELRAPSYREETAEAS